MDSQFMEGRHHRGVHEGTTSHLCEGAHVQLGVDGRGRVGAGLCAQRDGLVDQLDVHRGGAGR
eukprot:9592538-Heterocapsa_arctica.AAC.1